ncbi:hypothetical protein ASE00_21000 [Sphingomonas sp. Root710]|uniref:MFS transporter n=1 Tax=Sphingomonas sp. Root710 TaxID=1736594 RepID=UPI0006F908ED|nr:MFS transporter [Sphingomonas sp. Root710]KRB78858.1 hypothetical protein ASE00_21000 [Sphingomonas sp. Root710]
MAVSNKAAIVPDATACQASASWRAWTTLAILASFYVLSFVDRFIMALLLDPLKTDLVLSDLQLGFVFGTAFSIFYVAASIPLARFADTRNRKALIMAGVLFWSSCTALTAFASNYWVLSVLRIGLAIGEAALVPAAMSFISDLFPPRHRLIALTLFSATAMAGSSLTFLAGAALIQFIQSLLLAGFAPGWQVWRAVFIAVAMPGLALVALFSLVAREPARQGQDVDAKPGLGEILSHMQSNGWLYFGLFIGDGFVLMIMHGTAAWAPTYIQRAFGASVAEAGYAFGIAQAVAGGGGTIVLSILLRKLADAKQLSLAAALPIAASIGGALIMIVAPFAMSKLSFVTFYAFAGFLLIGTSNAVTIALQYFAPPRMRATLTAILLMITSIIGMGLGPVLVASLGRFGRAAPLALTWGISLNSIAGMVGCILFFGLSLRIFREALQRNA